MQSILVFVRSKQVRRDPRISYVHLWNVDEYDSMVLGDGLKHGAVKMILRVTWPNDGIQIN
jgi:hypothetical protein